MYKISHKICAVKVHLVREVNYEGNILARLGPAYALIRPIRGIRTQPSKIHGRARSEAKSRVRALSFAQTDVPEVGFRDCFGGILLYFIISTRCDSMRVVKLPCGGGKSLSNGIIVG